MAELPPHARLLLDAARSVDDPTPSERTRADAAARAVLARHGMHDLPALSAPNLPPSAAVGAAALRLGFALKWGVAAAALVTTAWLVWPESWQRTSAATALPPAAVPKPPAEAAQVAPQAPLSTPERVRLPPKGESPRAVAPIAPEELRVHLKSRSAPARRRAPHAPHTPIDDSALQRELRVIATVDQWVRQGQFDSALQLLEQSEREPGVHRLHEERSALRVLALCGKGPTEAALRQRERFLRLAPRSVLAARVRDACASRAGESE